MKRGRFISFEGIDGAGKSTQHSWMVEHLRRQGHVVVATREPGGTPLGEKLRAVLLAEPMHLETEALLMFAARREHVAQVIEPALTRGEWVVCDRFVDASFAYQGGGRGLDWNKLETLSRWVLGDLQPDLTFFFDAPVAVAQERLRAASGNRDRFEQEQAEFFERVRAAYLKIADEHPTRVQRIDATQAPDVINVLLEKIIATL
ncbi:MAG: dTMP kinase [Sulfuritalea sp.]|nr:dTMP kinase [Sulfuritalea sp.]